VVDAESEELSQITAVEGLARQLDREFDSEKDG
jgi:hypothetical protein